MSGTYTFGFDPDAVGGIVISPGDLHDSGDNNVFAAYSLSGVELDIKGAADGTAIYKGFSYNQPYSVIDQPDIQDAGTGNTETSLTLSLRQGQSFNLRSIILTNDGDFSNEYYLLTGSNGATFVAGPVQNFAQNGTDVPFDFGTIFDGSTSVTITQSGGGYLGDLIVSRVVIDDVKTIIPLTVRLVADTGNSTTDGITSNDLLTGTATVDSTVTVSDGSTVLGTAMADEDGNWTLAPNLTDGTYSLTVSESGNSGTATVGFTRDTNAPTLSMALRNDTGSSNSDHITVDPTLIGKADAGSVVTISDGTNVLDTATADVNGIWSFTPPLPNGSYNLTASETDAAGNIGTTTLAFTFDNSVPAVSMSLADNTSQSTVAPVTANPALVGTADAGSVVTISNGTTLLGTTTADINGMWSFMPPLLNGSYTLTASAIDAAGNVGTTTLTFTFDNSAPAVSMALADNTGQSTIAPITANPALTGTAKAGSVVTISNGTTVLGTATADVNGIWSFKPELIDGNYILTASQTGAAGTAVISFTLDSKAPVVSIGLLDDTGSSNSDHITSNAALTGIAEANSVVTVSNGSTVLGTSTADVNGLWSFVPQIGSGDYVLTASETDAAGNTGTATLVLTLDTKAPKMLVKLATAGVYSPDGVITSSAALIGYASPGSTVTVRDGGIVLGAVTADPEGRWSFAPHLLDGTYKLTASDTDAAGNIGTATIDFILDSHPTAISIGLVHYTGIADEHFVTNTAGLTGTAAPGSVVTVSNGGTMLGAVTVDPNGYWSFAPHLLDGTYKLTASDTDAAGNIGTATIAFTLDSEPPAISIGLVHYTGIAGEDFVSNTALLIGSASPGSVVTVSSGSDVLGTAMADTDGRWSYAPQLSDGTYQLTASDTDAAGNIGTATLTVILDTSAPAISMTLADNTGHPGGDLVTANALLTGTAAPGSVVTVTNGSDVLGTAMADTDGRWSFTPKLIDGTYKLTASDGNAAGNVGTATIDFTLDTSVPAISMALADNTGHRGGDLVTANALLTGTAAPGSVVTVSNGSDVLGTVTADIDGRWSFTPKLIDGTYKLTASDTDAAGNVGTATLAFTLDTKAPAISISLDASTGQPGEDPVTANALLTGTATPGSVVTVSNGSTVLGTVTADPNGHWSYAPQLPDGPYKLAASDTDAAGNIGTATLTFILDTSVPAISMTLADNTGHPGEDLVTANALLTGTAAPGSVVTVSNDGTVLGTATADPDGRWSFTPKLVDGTYKLTASDGDVAGNIGTATIAFTLDSERPAISIGLVHYTGTAGEDFVSNTALLIGSASPGSVVTVSNGSDVLGTAMADIDGRWSYAPQLSDGTYQLTAADTDAAGNIGTATLTFILDTSVPTISMTLADNTGHPGGDLVTANVLLTGTAAPGSVVTVSNGSNVLGTVTADTEGRWSFTPKLIDGTYKLTASDGNAAGNVGTATLAFTLDTKAPAISISLANGNGDSAGNAITTDPTVAGTAQAGSIVTISSGARVLGTTTADGNGVWSFTPTLAGGTYVLSASDTDAAGNTGTAAIRFTLDKVYVSNLNSDDTSAIFTVLDRPGKTAAIDLSHNSQPVTVFGGAASMDLTAQNATVIMNGNDQYAATTIHSLSKVVVWAGQSTIDVDGAGNDRVILTGGPGLTGSVNLHTTDQQANEVDVWGTAGTTQTVDNQSHGNTVVFGGASDLDFTGGNATIVLNGKDQTGSGTINSTGGNTIWAGSSALVMHEAISGNDTLLLTGASSTMVRGAAGGATGSTTVEDLGGTGSLEYDGGGKASVISIDTEHATVFGGSAEQQLDLAGSGSLVVADAETVSGLQTVSVGGGASGSLYFWGGGNDAGITLGGGTSFIKAGTANTTLTGGAGAFTLDLSESGRTIVDVDGAKSGAIDIYGYTGRNATLNITNVDSQSVIAGSLLMHLHDGSTITFHAYTPV